MTSAAIFYKNAHFIVYAREWEAGNTVYDLKDRRTGDVTYCWAIDPMDALRCVVDASRSVKEAA